MGGDKVKLYEIADKLGLVNLTPEIRANRYADVLAGYVSDSLSDVLANSPGGSVLITTHVHMNVIAVSAHVGLAGIIFASGRTPDEDVRKKAVDENLLLYTSKKSTFNIVGQLYALGLRDPNER